MMLQKENIKEYNSNWPQLHDHPYKNINTCMLWIWKNKSLFNLKNHQPNIDKIYLHAYIAKNLYKAKCHLTIKKGKNTSIGINGFNNAVSFFNKIREG